MMKIIQKIKCSMLFSIVSLMLLASTLYAREDYYDINNPNAPCKFETEYQRIKNNKKDPRVAYIDITPMVKPGLGIVSFNDLCLEVSQQTEDAKVIFDRNRGFFQIFYEDPSMTDAIAYFAGPAKSPGVMLYVTRYDKDWHTAVFKYDNKWHDVTNQYLGKFHLKKNDYVVVPQYGRSAKVLSFDGRRFRHKLWLTWDGTKFTASTAKKMPGWRCPDSYRYFDPSERKQYCQ